ncbi:15822_t:CDS:2 [Gigaspora rosea]|nr:15822_t:CDS:2 [Gigaspora rosea]
MLTLLRWGIEVLSHTLTTTEELSDRQQHQIKDRIIRPRNANVRPRMIHGYDAFFINWTNSYTLFQNGVEVLALRNQMQQTLEGVDWFEYDVEMGP